MNAQSMLRIVFSVLALVLMVAFALFFHTMTVEGDAGYPLPSVTAQPYDPYPAPTNTPRPTWEPPDWWPPFPLPSFTPTGVPAEMLGETVISLPDVRATQTVESGPSCEEKLDWALHEIANLRATIVVLEAE